MNNGKKKTNRTNLCLDCTVIGNGASRKKYNLDDIRHPTFGCNQLYKEHTPTFLVAKDRRVLEEMSRDGVEQVYVPFLSHRAHRDVSTITVPDMREIRFPYIRMNSWLTGEIAIVLAAQMGFENIDVIGFDGGPDSVYRGKTDTNVSLKHNQVPEWRYGHTFQKILQYYPDVTINTDTDFLINYK
tara:strand:- start:3114 stop:3668 length:555 start_codon:yes stop_codon:yes gene_type:complete